MSLAILLSGLVFIISYFYSNTFLTYLMFTSRFFMQVNASVIYTYTIEVFPTLYRTIGFGSCAAFGRLGAALTPFIIFPLMNVSLYLPLLLFGIG